MSRAAKLIEEFLTQNSLKESQPLIKNELRDEDTLIENKITSIDNLIENELTDIESLIENKITEQTKIKLIWNKLPSSIKSKVDIKKLSIFLDKMDIGMELKDAASSAKIPSIIAIDLMTAIEKSGVL